MLLKGFKLWGKLVSIGGLGKLHYILALQKNMLLYPPSTNFTSSGQKFCHDVHEGTLKGFMLWLSVDGVQNILTLIWS